MSKRYPIKNEEMLAGRVAKGFLSDSRKIAKSGETPANFSKVIEVQPYYIWSFIHESEHDSSGSGYTLSKAAERRVRGLAERFIAMDLNLLENGELWMHWKAA